jgi:hypothetical protein
MADRDCARPASRCQLARVTTPGELRASQGSSAIAQNRPSCGGWAHMPGVDRANVVGLGFAGTPLPRHSRLPGVAIECAPERLCIGSGETCDLRVDNSTSNPQHSANPRWTLTARVVEHAGTA